MDAISLAKKNVNKPKCCHIILRNKRLFLSDYNIPRSIARQRNLITFGNRRSLEHQVTTQSISEECGLRATQSGVEIMKSQ